MINTRIHDNRPRKNRKNRQHMRGYYSSLDVLNTLIEIGAERNAVNDAIMDAMRNGAGNTVSWHNVTFEYQGQGDWLKPMI